MVMLDAGNLVVESRGKSHSVSSIGNLLRQRKIHEDFMVKPMRCSEAKAIEI